MRARMCSASAGAPQPSQIRIRILPILRLREWHGIRIPGKWRSGMKSRKEVPTKSDGKRKKLRSGLLIFFNRSRGWNIRSRPEFRSEASDQFRGKIRNRHAFRYEELAAQNRAALIVVGELAIHLAILALLIPTEPAVRNGLGADELESAKKRIPLRDEKRLAHNRN